ncbi:hypothetical protein GCM10009744_63860 [Kribbella alba]|uniref:GNAT family N-acetyltransferase n=1 Tax=Kribbella alba TaxID=190197 RepID=A0ABN2FX31_9ACTN
MPDKQALIRPARIDDHEHVWPSPGTLLPRSDPNAPRSTPPGLSWSTAHTRACLSQRPLKWAQSIGAAYLALASRRAGPFYLALDYEDSAVFYKKTLT